MRIDETAEVLTKIAAYDRRKLGEADVRAWHAVINDVEKADAMAAVERWYAEETDWMMPAHLRRIVRDIVRERASAAAKWAPGQYGIPKAEPMPEISGPVSEGELTPEVRNLLASVRAMLPEGSREALMPRTVAWEQEQAAYQRHLHAVSNPHYRPRGDVQTCMCSWMPFPHPYDPEGCVPGMIRPTEGAVGE